jgi:hypothetical protein
LFDFVFCEKVDVLQSNESVKIFRCTTNSCYLNVQLLNNTLNKHRKFVKGNAITYLGSFNVSGQQQGSSTVDKSTNTSKTTTRYLLDNFIAMFSLWRNSVREKRSTRLKKEQKNRLTY